MTRVWILGASGSGKSTLARELSQRIGANLVDLDELNWRPNWQGAPESEFLKAVEGALAEPSWVVAGNYTKIQRQFLHLADTIIWLDYPLLFVLWRQTKRTFQRIRKRESCCNGNFETWPRTFSRDSVLLWLLRTFRRRKQSGWNTKRRARQLKTRFVHFRRPRDCHNWLQALRQTERAR